MGSSIGRALNAHGCAGVVPESASAFIRDLSAHFVIPAKAGILIFDMPLLDSRLRGNDEADVKIPVRRATALATAP